MKYLLITLLVVAPVWAQPKNDFDEQTGPLQGVVILTLDQAWQKLPSYQFGDSLTPLKVIEKAVALSPKTEAQRQELAAKLGAVLTNNQASKDAKKFACRQLAIVGGAAQVPALQTLLLGTDNEMAFFARFALERISDVAALDALRVALAKTKGETLAGVIDSLGARRDTNSVPLLKPLLQLNDELIVGATLKALGEIGGAQALQALTEVGFKADSPLMAVAQKAALQIADGMAAQNTAQAAPVYQKILAANPRGPIRIAAWRGVVKTSGAQAAPLIAEAFTSNDQTLRLAASGAVSQLPESSLNAVAQSVAALPEESQVLALNAMADFSTPAVREAAVAALSSKNEKVRLAALGTLANSGDFSTIGALLKVAANGTRDEMGAAQNSLSRLRGETVDAVLIEQLPKAQANERAAIAKTLGARRALNANEALVKAAGDVEANVRLTALEALGQIGLPGDVPALLELQPKVLASGGRELAQWEKTVAASARNGSDTAAALNSVFIAIKEAAPESKASLVRVAGAIGGERANAMVIEAVTDPDAKVRDAAVRALSTSFDPALAPVLLNVAQKGESAAHKVLAFRGYVKLADTNPKSDERLALYQAALPVAPPGERKAVLGGLGNIGTVDALKLVMPFLEENELREEGAAAVNAIAKKMLEGKSSANNKELLRGALKKVLEVSKDEGQRKQAAENLKKLG